MKILTVALLFFSALQLHGQCTKCNSFDEALKNPEMVRNLQINGWQHKIKLDSIPTSIALFSNIEILYLSDHNITTVPDEISNLKKLRELSFAGCKLKTLPDELFHLTNLKELILLDNEFSDKYKKILTKKFKKRLPNTKVLL